jgi:hypothetical protein
MMGAHPFVYYAIGGAIGVAMLYAMRFVFAHELGQSKRGVATIHIVPWCALGIIMGIICILAGDFLWAIAFLGLLPAMAVYLDSVKSDIKSIRQ